MRDIAKAVIILVAVAISSVAQQGKSAIPAAAGIENSCRSFVQNFYDWYVPLSSNDKVWRAWDVAVKKKPQAFTAELSQLIRKDTAAQRKASEIVGLDFDPFLNSQDPSERFVVESVMMKGAGCWVKVHGISERHIRETVTPEVFCKDGNCQFVNFHYDDNGRQYDLLTLLKSSN